MQKERLTTKTITKNKLVALRFRENEYNLIKSKADKANMNFTEFVTRSALNKQITIVDGLPKILKEVKAIGRNLNQLTTLCNMGKIICPELFELKEQYSNAVVMLDEIAKEVFVMATFVAIPEKTQTATAMKRVLDYVMQDKKTMFYDNENYCSYKLVSGQNCVLEAAFNEFLATKHRFNKAKGVFFKQYVQSFKPDCGATP